MSIPFHKQTDPNKQAGQIVYTPKNPPGLYLDSGEFIPAQELTLNDYIKRKEEGSKRITFAEWSKDRHGYDLTQHYFVMDSADMLECWEAAIKHGKIS